MSEQTIEVIPEDSEKKPDAAPTADDKSKKGDGEDTERRDDKSNFKKLYKSVKEKDRLIKELEAKLAKKSKKDDDDDGEDEDEDEDESSKSKKPQISASEIRIFLLETPEAKEYRESIEDIIEEYAEDGVTLSVEKAWKIVKADLPEKSKTKEDFDLKSEDRTTIRKKLSEINPNEALKLPKDQLKKWHEMHGTSTKSWVKKFGDPEKW